MSILLWLLIRPLYKVKSIKSLGLQHRKYMRLQKLLRNQNKLRRILLHLSQCRLKKKRSQSTNSKKLKKMRKHMVSQWQLQSQPKHPSTPRSSILILTRMISLTRSHSLQLLQSSKTRLLQLRQKQKPIHSQWRLTFRRRKMRLLKMTVIEAHLCNRDSKNCKAKRRSVRLTLSKCKFDKYRNDDEHRERFDKFKGAKAISSDAFFGNGP